MPALWRVVRIERFLHWAQGFGYVLKVDADPRPGREPSAHGIDEHIGRLKMGRGLWMACTPPLESGERLVFRRGAADFDERMLRRSLP